VQIDRESTLLCYNKKQSFDLRGKMTFLLAVCSRILDETELSTKKIML
jgi:hypothetical protein